MVALPWSSTMPASMPIALPSPEVQDHGAVMPLPGGLVDHPLGGHRLAVAGVGGEGGVEEAVLAQVQGRLCQLGPLHAPLVTEHHIAGHIGHEGEGWDALLRGD